MHTESSPLPPLPPLLVYPEDPIPDRKRMRADFEDTLNKRIEETNWDLRLAYEEIQKENKKLEAQVRQCEKDKVLLYQNMKKAEKRMNEAEELVKMTNEFWNNRQKELEASLLRAWMLAKIPLSVTPMPREQGNGTA